jgi:hypothetical protein
LLVAKKTISKKAVPAGKTAPAKKAANKPAAAASMVNEAGSV